MPRIGDLEKVTINKVDYDVIGGSTPEFMLGKYSNENVPTTGANQRKKMRRSEDITGIELAVTGADADNLKDVSEQTADVDLAVVDGAGNTYTASGGINISSYSLVDGKITVDLLPTLRWTPIVV